MKEEKNPLINQTMENKLLEIDEEQLPQIFREQISLVEKANQKYADAKAKKEKAEKSVESAKLAAKDFISKAKSTGLKKANKSKILWIERTSQKDEINAIKENLNDIISHNVKSAEAQESLALVQSSLLDSQASLLEVQKVHMEYQQAIANATKFVFGLSAYNIGTSQSILLKLKAVLSEASEKELGELAQQQLFLALDQIKNQENIITRMNENDLHIKNLSEQIEKKKEEIFKIKEKDQEQDKLLKIHSQTDEKHEELINKLFSEDDEQDKLLELHSQTDEKHEKLISNLISEDNEQDRLLEQHSQTDEKHEELISKLILEDNQQDKFLEKLEKRDLEFEEKIKSLESCIRDLRIYCNNLEKEINGKSDKKITYILIIVAFISLILSLTQSL